jgi:hypothetical protein
MENGANDGQENRNYSTVFDDWLKKIPDSELISMVTEASIYVLIEKHRKILYYEIDDFLKPLGINCSDSNVEFWFDEFYKDLITLKKNGDNKFDHIENKKDVRSWLCTCCTNFLTSNINKGTVKNLRNKISDDIDCAAETDANNDADAKLHEELLMKELIFFSDKLNQSHLYIMLTYMYHDNLGMHVIRLDKKIADTLNQVHAREKKFFSRRYKKFKTHFN